MTAAIRRMAHPAPARMAAVSLLFFLLGAGPMAGVARAATPAALAKSIADVASSDAAVQEAAAVALGKSGDRQVLPLLEALREGSVYVRTLPSGEKETV